VTERAQAVSDVQVLLARAGYNNVNAFGGSFGPLTQSWVRSFQRDWRLRVTGVVNRGTWRELLSWCGPQDT
jgi:peptidoglycan hydrolase-like protein with peptidoglycan-binding domain